MPSRTAPLEDAGAFSQLYERAHLMVFRFIYGLHGGPVQEVEDLTAETFMRAWKARQRFDGNEDAAVGWLLRIARNLVIDTHRRKNVRGTELSLEDALLPSPDASPEEQVALVEQIKILWVMMAALPTHQREMVVLRYLLGWPIKRIAAHLDMLDNTVSVTLRRTLLRLRRDWPGK